MFVPVTTNHFPGWGISVIFDLTVLSGGREFDRNFLEDVKIPPYAPPFPPPPPAGLTLIGALYVADKVRRERGKVLVHCIAGVSR